MGKEKENLNTALGRREFLKIGSAGAVFGAAGLASAPRKAAGEVLEKETKKAVVKAMEEFPVKVSPDYKPFQQKNTVFSRAKGRIDPELAAKARTFERFETDESRPGYSRIDWALHHGSWAIEHAATPGSKFGMPNTGWYSWQQNTHEERANFLDLNYLNSTRHEFASKKEASAVIKRAARHFSADLVGITPRNKMWDYDKHFVALSGEEIGWDQFPFEPKSVIVIGVEMDYENMATAPSYTVEGAIGEGYSQMAVTAFQLSVFLKNLGYKAVAAGNDLGMSVPYGIAAGLGEGGRNGLLINYKYGPRFRIAKVYTDIELVEYDKPVTFGVREFCKRCQRCADACPSKSIPNNVEPTMQPTHGGETWFNNAGVEKWYINAKKCFEYWCEGNNSCATCITSCPYNKPDFWHHKLVDKVSALMPGPVHSFMREMDIVFGYGDTFDEKAVKKFWSDKDREYNGI